MIVSNIPSSSSSISKVRAKVDFFNGSTLVTTCTCSDALSDFTITREGDNSKFFGFGVCQKVSINLLDFNHTLDVSASDNAELAIGNGDIFDNPYPTFYLTELSRNEDTDIITVTAYDKLYNAAKHMLADLDINIPYTLYGMAQAIANRLGLTLTLVNISSSVFNLNYPEGANFNGNENLRQVLDLIAEATQTIYYIDYQNRLAFKRLDSTGDSVLTINRNNYFELKTSTPRKLTTICSTSDLDETGLEATTGEEGFTQYVRSNPFWDLRTDLNTLLTNAIARIGNITFTQFNLSWIGNYLLEIGDKISLETSDNSLVDSYVLSNSLTFNGIINENISWEYSENKVETTLSNPSTIGEKINETYARVDKVNKKVDILVSDVQENTSTIAQIQVTLDGIDLKIENSVDKALEEYLPPEVEDLGELKKTVATHTEQISGIEIDLGKVTTTVGQHTTKINTLEDDTGDLKERVTETENNISTLEQTTTSINATVTSQGTKITELEDETGELKQTTETHTEQIGSLSVKDNEILATVSNITETSRVSTENMEQQIEQLTQEVSTKVTAEDLTIAVKNEIANGVDKVETVTGFTFNDQGLTVSKSGKEMSTTITEDGMTVYKDSTAVLTADNIGVDAKNLKASTYLVIGTNSRFENYGTTRTACFWIGD